MARVNGLIFDIKRFAIHDGPGIRTTVFFKGCPLRCWWCHNPESQKQQIEKIKKINYLKMNDQTQFDSVGKLINIEQLMKEISKDIVFFDESCGGVTFSGGEALMQPEFLFEISKECKNSGIHTTLDTCGYTEIENLRKICKNIDLFLYDIKFIDEKLHEKYTGISNKLIIKNIEYLKEINKDIIIRIPIIPGITDTKENLISIGEYLSSLNIKDLNLLNYNRIGIEKYKRLSLDYRLPNIVPPSSKRIKEIKKILEEFGLFVQID